MGIETVAGAFHRRCRCDACAAGRPRRLHRSAAWQPTAISILPTSSLAAEIAQCDAIHPGNGFLSENAKFADIVEAHDIAGSGPKPEHIRTMGDKIEAKKKKKKKNKKKNQKTAHRRRARSAAGPRPDGAVSDIAEAKAIAEAAGYPVIIKAASGGGGARHESVQRARTSSKR